MKQTWLFLILLGLSACRSADEIKPERKDLTHAVYASGKIFPLNHYVVLSKYPGYIRKLLVKAGDSVAAGTPLVIIENTASEMNEKSARNLYDLAMQNADENGPVLKALIQETKAARSKYELDSTNLKRSEALFASDALSRLNLDQARTLSDASKATYIKATEGLSNTRSRLRVELLIAQNQWQALLANRQEYTILSVISGKVYDILPEEGDLAAAAVPLMELGSNDLFEVELSVDETDIAFIKPGQKAVYSIDAYTGSLLEGVITSINPKVNPVTKTARVFASISQQAGMNFYSAMSVEANIIIAEKKGVLVVPIEYVKGKKVMVKNEKEPRTVTTGISDLNLVEITDGLSGNEVLVKQ